MTEVCTEHKALSFSSKTCLSSLCLGLQNAMEWKPWSLRLAQVLCTAHTQKNLKKDVLNESNVPIHHIEL